MNLRTITIILLVLNLGILVYLVATRAGHPEAGAPPQEPIIVFQPAPAPPPSEPAEIITLVTNDFQWAQLESEDYREYITRLRSIGCPEETLRDIIISDLDKLFAPQLRALMPYRTNLQFWHSEEEELLNEVNADQLLREERAIEAEKRAVVRELIGVDLASQRLSLKGRTDYYDRRLQFLDPEKREATKALLEKYHALDWEIRQKELPGEGGLNEEDRAELKRVREKRDAELSNLLTPQERQDFDLWMSETSSKVRHDTYGMEASEEEFRAIYNARQNFDQAWPKGETDLEDPEVKARWELAREEVDLLILQELGQDRFLEYKRGQDTRFHDLARLVTQHNLPREIAVTVYDYQTAYQDQRDAVAYSRNLTAEQKQQALVSLHAETLSAVEKALGPAAFRRYRHTADWLK